MSMESGTLEVEMYKFCLNSGKSQRMDSRISTIYELIGLMDPKCLGMIDTMDDIELVHNGEVVFVMKNVPVSVTYEFLCTYGLIK
jgi:hypothetical protein